MDYCKVTKKLLSPTGQITTQLSHAFLRTSSSLLSSSHFMLDKSRKAPQNIGDKYKEIIEGANGLQTILKNDANEIFNRTQIEETEGYRDCPSDSKSTKSETNSIKTYKSSASNGLNSKQSNNDVITPNTLNEEDFIQKYYKELRSALKNCITTKKPPVYFKDIAGNHYAKKIMKEAFVLPNLIPGYFAGGKVKPWNKILLYGPPGVGKTMMCQAVATEMNASVLWVSLADITSKYTGESEKLLIALFDMAREKSPSVIIIDEMDSIGRKRSSHENETERRIKTEFLKQLDGINSGSDGVYVLSTTNMPWELDIACIRRFERLIFLPLPDKNARKEIFRLRLGDHPHELKDEDFTNLAESTKGYSGSDICNVVNDAMMKPVRMIQETCFFKVITEENKSLENDKNKEFYMPCHENEKGAIKLYFNEIPKDQILFRKLNFNDFKESIKNCRPTVHSKFLPLYREFGVTYGHVEQNQDFRDHNHKEYLDYFM